VKDAGHVRFKFDTVVAPHEGSEVLFSKLAGKHHAMVYWIGTVT